MAGTFELDWWRIAVKQLTDEQLEQVASGLGRERERSAVQNMVAIQIMHDEVLGDLGRRSRAILARQRVQPPRLQARRRAARHGQ